MMPPPSPPPNFPPPPPPPTTSSGGGSGICAGMGAHYSSCSRKSDCCSNRCRKVNGVGSCYCKPTGRRCSRSQECCSLSCQSGRCSNGGAPVSSPSPPPPPTFRLTAPPAGSSDSCRDNAEFAASCPGWARQGHCTSNFAAWMSDNCPHSCNTDGCADISNPTSPPPTSPPPTSPPPTTPPPSQTSSSCSDRSNDCPGWQRQGLCPPHAQWGAWMTENCPATCNVNGCAGQGNPTPPPPTSPPPTSPPPTSPPPTTPPPTQGGGCSNNPTFNGDCPGWQQQGFCPPHAQWGNFMRDNCPATCNVCGGGGNDGGDGNPPPPPPTPPPSPPAGNCRVRRSWYRLSAAERSTFSSLWVRISRGEHGAQAQSRFRNLIDMHQALWTVGNLHNPIQFLPWHRWYVNEMENIFRTVQPSFTMPYWPWEDDGGFQSSIWNADPNVGIGGGFNNGCVNDGPFRQSEYSMTNFATQASGNSCIRRRRQGGLPSRAAIRSIQSLPASQYGRWVRELDSVHGAVHCAIDGTMCERVTVNGQMSFTAANAPEFFLHHCNIDKLWAQWQSTSQAHASAHEVNPGNLQLSGTGVNAGSVMNIRNMGGICVEYDDPRMGFATDLEADGATDQVECPPPWLSSAQLWWSGMPNTNATEVQTKLDSLSSFYCGEGSNRVPPLG